MIPLVPKEVAGAIDTAQKMVTKFRADFSALLADQNEFQRLDKNAIRQLYGHAVIKPEIVQLSELLARLVPVSLVGFASQGSGSPAPQTGERMLKLCAAVIQAGLAEQLNPDGSVRNGNALSASALERSLDEWMIRGRHRANFEDAPLSKIDDMIAMHDGAPVAHAQVIETRFGLLVPVLANIHLWRTLEQLPFSQAHGAGWCTQASKTAQQDVEQDVDASSNMTDKTSDQAQHG